MTDSLIPTYTLGTHRLAPPEQTLARIEPLLARCGITRLAEITGLDEDFGVPTYTAVRPGGLVLQTGNGKGLTKAAAKVSAAMEAIELYHAENPDRSRFVRASLLEMRRRGLLTFVPPRDEADRRFYFSEGYEIDWVRGEELVGGADVWVPASAACFIEPTIYQTNTNGLASGNHVVEATLHAIYELLERDAISRVVQGDVVDIPGKCRVVDPASIEDERLRQIIQRIEDARSRLVLLWVPCEAPVHVFWSFLLDLAPQHAATSLITGAGAHVDPHAAAARAITEAVQSRLTIVQSVRDDVGLRPSFSSGRHAPSRATRYFADLEADTAWPNVAERGAIPDPIELDMSQLVSRILVALAKDCQGIAVRVELSRPELDVPVVKLLVPHLQFRRQLF
ncbi:MAG: YcaO-like family protein [Myxococcales bacterium]|nr:YcaO-like family protein [Myxococcales bacterium]